MERRVFIPEGTHGEGWLSFSRKIKDQLQQLKEQPTVKHPVRLTDKLTTSEHSWMSFKNKTPFGLGGWEFMVVCTIDHQFVDWTKVGRRLAVVLEAEEDFQFFPFSANQAIIAVESMAERDLLCNSNDSFDEEDGITLSLWNQSSNGLLTQDTNGGWIGLSGLPFHLWSGLMFTSIASKMGGLHSVDANTSGFNDLSMARIRVKRDRSRIPARIEVEDAGVRYPVDIRIIPTPESFKQGMVKISVTNGGFPVPERNINSSVGGMNTLTHGLHTQALHFPTGDAEVAVTQGSPTPSLVAQISEHGSSKCTTSNCVERKSKGLVPFITHINLDSTLIPEKCMNEGVNEGAFKMVKHDALVGPDRAEKLRAVSIDSDSSRTVTDPVVDRGSSRTVTNPVVDRGSLPMAIGQGFMERKKF